MTSILICNGTVVNDDCMFKSDVLIRDGKIVEVAENLQSNGANCEVIDATDRYIIPGGIDPHTHMQMPYMDMVTADDFYHGTRAALAGGTTMIIDFVQSNRDRPPLDAYHLWRKWADAKVCCDYGLSMAITYFDGWVKNEMSQLMLPEYGINSFKFYLAYKGTLMVEDDVFFQCLKHCARIGALARVHAENGSVIAEKEQELLQAGVTGPEGHTQARPEELEAEATNRACVLAGEANCPLYVVHVMSSGAAEAIAKHRQRGRVIFGEPIAAGLALDGSHYYHKDWRHAAAYVMSPPLSRKADTPRLLMELLASGQLHLTGTDNCTYTCEQKRKGFNDFTKIPNGINGLEDRLSIIWEKGVVTGIIDPMRFVAITSSTAAKIFNVYPQKGRVRVGADADLVIWNGQAKRTISAATHHHAIDFNIYEGMTVHGVAEVTISRGRVVWRNGKFADDLAAGSGRFVPLLPNCNYVFGAIRAAEKHRKPAAVDRETCSKDGVAAILKREY